jgi:hypothetical protein
MNIKQIDENSLEFDGIDHRDYPDYVDAYLTHAETLDGYVLTDDELSDLQDDNPMWFYERLMSHIH